MLRIRQIGTSSIVAAVVVPLALAQAPPPSPGASQAASASTQRRSIVHHYPYPYPEYYHGDQTAGFRNPGSQGRYLEYYPPGNTFQVRGDPTRVATFDRGGGAPDRAEQLAAQQIGIQRYNAIQSHIDNYARPAFGVGYFGGLY
jgi:hypothetical protein